MLSLRVKQVADMLHSVTRQRDEANTEDEMDVEPDTEEEEEELSMTQVAERAASQVSECRVGRKNESS